MPPLSQLPDIGTGLLRAYTVARPGSTLPSDRGMLIDRDGHACRAYDIRDAAMILVLPDGYSDLTGGSLDQEPILDYLRDVIKQ